MYHFAGSNPAPVTSIYGGYSLNGRVLGCGSKSTGSIPVIRPVNFYVVCIHFCIFIIARCIFIAIKYIFFTFCIVYKIRMFFNNFFLLFFELLTVFCVVLSVFSKNTVHSILYLILVFCNNTCILFLLNVEYLAMVYVVVYIGAIAVLFLFVVMMLNIKLLEVNDTVWRYIPIGVLVMLVLFFEVFYLLSHAFYIPFTSSYIFMFCEVIPFYISSDLRFFLDFFNYTTVPVDAFDLNSRLNWFDNIVNVDNIHSIGYLMYSYYGVSFILSSFILLVAMLGSIILTLRDSLVTKRQDLFSQVSRTFSDSLTY